RAKRAKRAGKNLLLQSVFEKWVARATRLFRSATRRPERARLSPAEGCRYSLPMRSPFGPASRRTAQASGLCYPKRNFQTRSQPFFAANQAAFPDSSGPRQYSHYSEFGHGLRFSWDRKSEERRVGKECRSVWTEDS